MYGSLTTKEIKKKHSSRPVGGAETGSWAERTHGRKPLADPARWQIVEWDGKSCNWPVSQQLVDWATDRITQSSSVGK